MTIAKRFVAADGKEFTSKSECQKYEVRLSIARLVHLDRVGPLDRSTVLGGVMSNINLIAKLARKAERLSKTA